MISRLLVLIIGTALVLFMNQLVKGGTLPSIHLTWSHAVEREDGKPLMLSEIHGYRLYWTSTAKSGVIELPVSTSYVFYPEGAGTYLFQISTVDTDMQEGKKSEAISVPLAFLPDEPNPPGSLGAVFSCDGCGLVQEGAQ